jgi:adenylosuccinate lyase
MANLSLPGNPRYQPKELQVIFGYDWLYRPVAEIEIATLRVLAQIGVISAEDDQRLTAHVERELLNITTTEVDRVERTDTEEFGKKTQHDIRAWVRIAQSKVPVSLRRWIHVPLTSYDALDTARSLMFVRGHEVVRSLTNRVIDCFVEQVRKYAAQPQIGRTHGQHALPITVGFWLASTLSRLLMSIQSANRAAQHLVGKISGAVGAYNAQVGLGIAERCGRLTFEQRVLAQLSLESAPISTQILPPEPLADYLFNCLKLSAALGQFGRDCRHLMRTEIGEVSEPFEQGQVGSSTMAHKRNPIHFENLEGTWLKNQVEFGKVLACMVSDHQRDLVGSSIVRDFPTIVVNLVLQLNTLLRESDGKPFILRIAVDPEACRRNLEMQGDVILAEPMYIALQMAGYKGDAHELVNHKAMPRARAENVPLLEGLQMVINEDPDALDVWRNIPHSTIQMLNHPEKYVGAAQDKAIQVAKVAEVYLDAQ